MWKTLTKFAAATFLLAGLAGCTSTDSSSAGDTEKNDSKQLSKK